VDGYEVDRLRLQPEWRAAPEAILERAGRLLVPVTGGPAVILQPRSA
jgi:hypothetical protein